MEELITEEVLKSCQVALPKAEMDKVYDRCTRQVNPDYFVNIAHHSYVDIDEPDTCTSLCRDEQCSTGWYCKANCKEITPEDCIYCADFLTYDGDSYKLRGYKE